MPTSCSSGMGANCPATGAVARAGSASAARMPVVAVCHAAARSWSSAGGGGGATSRPARIARWTDTTCPTRSRTVHSVHGVGAFHWSDAIPSTRAPKPAATRVYRSACSDMTSTLLTEMSSLVVHGGHDVLLGVEELEQAADRRDLHVVVEDRAAVGHHGGADRGQVVDRDRAVEPPHAGAGQRLLPLVQRALDSRVGVGPREDAVEARRPPRLEPPSEDGRVEALGPGDVVGVNGEVNDVVRHASERTHTTAR